MLVTATGSPGGPRLVRSLRENGERELSVIGTDITDGSAGRFLCDAFHVVPRGDDPSFAATLADLAEREGVDCVLPTSSSEVLALAQGREHFAMPLLVADAVAIARCQDKAATAEAAARAGVAGARDASRSHAGRVPRGGRGPRLSRSRRLHEAAGRQGIARLPGPLRVGRPPTRAARGAPRPAPPVGRRGARCDRRRRLPAAARDGARDRARAHGRRHLPGRPARARPRQDA